MREDVHEGLEDKSTMEGSWMHGGCDDIRWAVGYWEPGTCSDDSPHGAVTRSCIRGGQRSPSFADARGGAMVRTSQVVR